MTNLTYAPSNRIIPPPKARRARAGTMVADRSLRILIFLADYFQERGLYPTIREIGYGTGITSTSVVNYYLNKLCQEHQIERARAISRGISLTEYGMRAAIEAGHKRRAQLCPHCGHDVNADPVLDPLSDKITPAIKIEHGRLLDLRGKPIKNKGIPIGA